MKEIKIIVERHSDGYIAYPIGIKGVVIGEGDTFEKAQADVKSAIKFHLETFSDEEIYENERFGFLTLADGLHDDNDYFKH